MNEVELSFIKNSILKNVAYLAKKRIFESEDIEEFKENDLLANNGELTNLTAEEWKYVRTPEFKSWFGDWEYDPENASKILDANNEPIVLYHSYDYDNYDSGMIYCSSNLEFSEEFGEYTDEVFVNLRNPYIAEDGILRDKDGNEIMFEGEPASVGYLDSVPEEYLAWLEDNFDGVTDKNYTFLVVFDKENLRSADPNKSLGEGD